MLRSPTPGSVSLDNVSKRFGATVACHQVSLHAKGGIVGLLGPNGAGKTSLLSMLSGGLEPSHGIVSINGHDVYARQGRRAARGAVGYLPQRYDLAGGMKVVDVVRYAAWCNGVDRGDLDDAVGVPLALTGLSERGRDRVRKLSGGQRQRLGLAASLAHRPGLLLLDEPTAGLDLEQRVRFRGYLRKAAQDTTVLVATHLLEDVQHIAEQLVVIDYGQIVFDGTPESLAECAPGPESVDVQSDLERGYREVIAADPTDPGSWGTGP